MRDSIFHRWFVVGLLLLKLVFGALAPTSVAHATALDDSPMSNETTPCPDHDQAHAGKSTHTTGVDVDDSTHATHDGSSDCCCENACECPCAHATTLLTTLAPAWVARSLDSNPASYVVPRAAARPTNFFRPPI